MPLPHPRRLHRHPLLSPKIGREEGAGGGVRASTKLSYLGIPHLVESFQELAMAISAAFTSW